jgi:hypothetical protein
MLLSKYHLVNLYVKSVFLRMFLNEMLKVHLYRGIVISSYNYLHITIIVYVMI